jgi:hypothetical protein
MEIMTCVVGVVGDLDHSAEWRQGIIEAIAGQLMHTLPTHVGEVHRRAGRVLLCYHFDEPHRSDC